MNSLDSLAAPVGAVWPPPSTEQSPVFEIKFTKAIIRSQLFSIWFYQPAFRGHKMEVSEHGITGLNLRSGAASLSWSDVKSVTLARKRNQVCILYRSPILGMDHSLSSIVSTDQENFDHVGGALRRFARCSVVEDETIYWSYSKLIFWYSLFWLCELFLISRSHHGQWTAYWQHALMFLNHLVSLNLP